MRQLSSSLSQNTVLRPKFKFHNHHYPPHSQLFLPTSVDMAPTRTSPILLILPFLLIGATTCTVIPSHDDRFRFADYSLHSNLRFPHIAKYSRTLPSHLRRPAPSNPALRSNAPYEPRTPALGPTPSTPTHATDIMPCEPQPSPVQVLDELMAETVAPSPAAVQDELGFGVASPSQDWDSDDLLETWVEPSVTPAMNDVIEY